MSGGAHVCKKADGAHLMRKPLGRYSGVNLRLSVLRWACMMPRVATDAAYGCISALMSRHCADEWDDDSTSAVLKLSAAAHRLDSSSSSSTNDR